jgi:hypothetical protein
MLTHDVLFPRLPGGDSLLQLQLPPAGGGASANEEDVLLRLHIGLTGTLKNIFCVQIFNLNAFKYGRMGTLVISLRFLFLGGDVYAPEQNVFETLNATLH